MKEKFNFYLGAAVSAWLLAILVIAAELIAPFKALLTKLFTHHWIGKFVLITIAFIAFGFLLKGRKSIGKLPDSDAAWYITLGSLIIILLFYIFEFFV